MYFLRCMYTLSGGWVEKGRGSNSSIYFIIFPYIIKVNSEKKEGALVAQWFLSAGLLI